MVLNNYHTIRDCGLQTRVAKIHVSGADHHQPKDVEFHRLNYYDVWWFLRMGVPILVIDGNKRTILGGSPF